MLCRRCLCPHFVCCVVLPCCIACLQGMLKEYAANPAQNWKAKDTAIYLVLALTVQGKTGACTRVPVRGLLRKARKY